MNSKNSKTRAPAKSPAKSSTPNHNNHVVVPPSPRHAPSTNPGGKNIKVPSEQNIVVVAPPSPQPTNAAPIPKKVLKVGKEGLQIQSGKEKISSSQEKSNSEKKRGKTNCIQLTIVGPKKAASELEQQQLSAPGKPGRPRGVVGKPG